MIGFESFLFTDELSKSCTITWRSDKLRGKRCLSRFKILRSDLALILYTLGVLHIPYLRFVGQNPTCWRAFRAGKLIVRLATYQGVDNVRSSTPC